MLAIIEVLKNFWNIIANTNGEYNLADLSILQTVMVAGFIFVIFKLLKIIFSNGNQGLKTMWKTTKKIASFNKRRMAKPVCQRCGRHLDKCSCLSNKNLSLKKRFKKYKATKKLQKLEAKAKQQR